MDKKILLVDDDIKIFRAVKRLALFENWEMHHVFNADAAIKTLEEFAFDLVITDFRMPGMNGIEMAGILKEKFPNLPVILFTGYADKELVIKAFSNRAIVAVITKPFDEDVLIDKIKKRLNVDSQQTISAIISTLKLLIVEDDRAIIRVYEHWSKEAGFDFKIAQNGISGLELYQSWKPNFIILDLGLPAISGYSLLKIVRQFNKDTIVVIATGKNDLGDLQACIDLGIEGYLLKPFSCRTFIGEIERCLSERKKQHK